MEVSFVIIVGVCIYLVETGLTLGMKGIKSLKTNSETTTAASETTFKPIPRSVSPPGWKHFSMQIPAPTGWHSA